MINNSPFDDHIKKQFGNYKPEVPPHIWENIMAQKEKRKPGGFLFFLRDNRFLLLVLLLIATGAGALLVHNINKNDTTKLTSNDPAAAAPVVSKEQDNASQNIASENKDKTGQIASSDGNSQAKTITRPGGDRQTGDQGPGNSNKINNNQKDVNTVTSKNNIVTSKNNELSKSITNAGNNMGLNSGTTGTKNKNKQVRRSAAKKNMVIESPVAEVDPVTQEEVATVANTTIDNNASLTKYYLDINTKPSDKTFSFYVKNINIPALNIPCPGSTKNNAANKRYFEVYGGPDYIYRTFNDTANSTYLRKRKESTSVSSAFSFGVRYTKVFNNAISFRAGLNYSQINEKFKYEQGHMVQLVYVLGPGGDTIGSYATTGTRYKTTHNKYRTIDIPITVGYEFGNGRLRTNIGAGLIINAYSWQKGDLLDSSYQPVNITTGKPSSPYQFKTNVGLGFTGSVSFYYKLTGNLHFLAEPYFRYNFSPANKADITLKQKYTTLGLRIGLRMDF